MLRRLLITLVVIAAVTAALFSYLYVDWYAWGNAVPPDPSELSESDHISLEELLFNDQSVMDSEVRLKSNEEISYSGKLKTKVSEWRWSALSHGGRTMREIRRYVKATAHLPRLDLFLEFRSKSSFPPGYQIGAKCVAHEVDIPPETVGFSGKFNAPPRPGTYEVRLFVVPTPFGPIGLSARNKPVQEIVIGSYNVSVADENETDEM